MKIKIDADGNLHVGGKRKFCPLASSADGGFTACGEWCALLCVYIRMGQIIIQLCGERDWNCSPSDFTDERPRP